MASVVDDDSTAICDQLLDELASDDDVKFEDVIDISSPRRTYQTRSSQVQFD